MGGLARIAKMLGGMTISANGRTVNYVWDYVADEAVPHTEMPVGSPRWCESERKRWSAYKADAALIPDARQIVKGEENPPHGYSNGKPADLPAAADGVDPNPKHRKTASP
jgi:hypothetical protein